MYTFGTKFFSYVIIEIDYGGEVVALSGRPCSGLQITWCCCRNFFPPVIDPFSWICLFLKHNSPRKIIIDMPTYNVTVDINMNSSTEIDTSLLWQQHRTSLIKTSWNLIWPYLISQLLNPFDILHCHGTIGLYTQFKNDWTTKVDVWTSVVLRELR